MTRPMMVTPPPLKTPHTSTIQHTQKNYLGLPSINMRMVPICPVIDWAA